MSDFKKSGGFRSNKEGRGGFDRGGSDRPRFGGGQGGFRGGGERGGPTRRSFSEGGRPQMFSATCSECNRACEIPFRPTGDRPVFCKDCFDKQRGGPTRRSFSEGGSQDGFGGRREAPSRNFSNNSNRNFSPSSSSKPQADLSAVALAKVEDKRIDELKRQLDAVNKKLDTMMELIQGLGLKKSVAKAVLAGQAKTKSKKQSKK